MFNDLCFWLSTRSWKRLAWRSALTYGLMLTGVLGVDLINVARGAAKPEALGYVLLFASYIATAALWSRSGVRAGTSRRRATRSDGNGIGC
jgi:hypothetical protein